MTTDAETLLAYLQLCIRDRDWHGVWDTAIMLEVLDAKAKQSKEENANTKAN
jgi:hypothetical protein